MNKQLFLTFFCAIGLTAMMAHGSVVAKGNTETLPPMFALGIDHGMMQVVYWSYTDEPQLDAEYPEFYEEEHQAWQLQENLRHNAAQYTKLIENGGMQMRGVRYVDEVLLDPDGKKMFPGELHGRSQIPSPGARFALLGEPALKDDELPGMLIVTDNYLANHRLMEIKPASQEGTIPLPDAVIKQMEKEYGMKVDRSIQDCIIDGRYIYGVLQFAGQYKSYEDRKTALALEILIDGNKIYSFPDEGWYDPDEGPIWHVDDGGEFVPSDIVAAFDGPQGPELYFIHWAPESATIGMLGIDGGKLNRQDYTVYHSLIDEELPVWIKDIEEMKRLYVADDPGENNDDVLTKWAHVYLDYDGEQIWISDNEEENGAFFTRENGELKLIATVRANLKPSFPGDRGEDSFLMLSGPAGGPSYYYEIYTFRGGKVVEKFTALEVYGELDGCSLNGQEISVERGKAYMDAIPEATEHYIGWNEINPKY